jgi:nitrite reductase (NO-forming)
MLANPDLVRIGRLARRCGSNVIDRTERATRLPSFGSTFTCTLTADYAGSWMYHRGTAPALHDHPLPVTTKGRTRVFMLDAGPSVDSSFHVVGTIFDTVTKEGVGLARGNRGDWGWQAVDLAPAHGAIVEFSPREDGMYPFVTHAFNLVTHGAIGIFSAGDGR